MGKRILILTRTFPPSPGAVGHLVKELGTALIQEGFEVAVIAAGAGADSQDAALRVVQVGSLPFSRKSHFQRALSYLSLYPAMLWAAAGERRPDVVITTTDPPLQAVLGWFLKVRFGCKLVHWSQDLYPEVAEEAGVLKRSGTFANALRWISNASLMRHDKVVSIGRCMTARLIARGLDAERITEIANWTNPADIFPIQPTASRFAQRENIGGRFVVAYSGNLGMAHSFTEILEAAALLQSSAPDVLFVFIGEGPRKKAVVAAVQEQGLENVRFFPAQPWRDLSDSLGAAHLHLVSLRPNMSGLVVPSKFYGIMAAGRPSLFVGPGDSEVARVITEKKTGRVVASGSSAEIAAAILFYRDNPEIWQEEGMRGRAFGEQAHLRNATNQFCKLLEISNSAKNLES